MVIRPEALGPVKEEITLFPYQQEGARWLSSRKHGLLADEMGLGKSAQIIEAANILSAKRILVFCPASVRPGWIREFQKFSSPEIQREFLVIETKPQCAVSSTFDHDLIVCSYDLAEELLAGYKNSAQKRFDMLILDEAHYVKSTLAARTKALLAKGGFIHHSERTYFVTGTPAPNNPSELWPMLFTTGIIKMGYEHFVERFCRYYEFPIGGAPRKSFAKCQNVKKISGAREDRIPELRKILSGFMLRRQKESVMKQLPPIHYMDVIVEPGVVHLDMEPTFLKWVLDGNTEKFYEMIDNQERILLENIGYLGARGTPETVKMLEAMAPSLATLRRYTGMQKVNHITHLVISELEAKAYEKIVIFAIHQSVIEGIRLRLRKFKPVTVYGKTPPSKRQALIDKFQNDVNCRVFIGNVQAAGTGITLTAAHHVLFVEASWVPGENMQAAMRCHRIGQTKPVFVRFVGLLGSVDEKIQSILKTKTKELTMIFDSNRMAKLDPKVEASLPENFDLLKELSQETQIETEKGEDIFS